MIVKFLDKLGNLVKSITSIAYLPVDTEPVEDSGHLITSGAVAEIVPEGTSKDNQLMNAEETERMIDIMKPIDALTLRFEFSKKDYNPETAGVGSTGTWTKVDSPTLNIWDWTTDATDWTSAFQGAFPDADNEVSIIAAGDTSDVTSFEKLFAGVFNNYAVGTANYVLSSRNNVVSCVPFDVSSATSVKSCFQGTTLREVVKLDFSKSESCDGRFTFADSFVHDFDEIELYVTSCLSMFSMCYNLVHVGKIKFDPEKIKNIDNNKEISLFNVANALNKPMNIETIEGVEGLGLSVSFSNLFTRLRKLKRFGERLDCSSLEYLIATFQSNEELEELPELYNIGEGKLKSIYLGFQSCKKIKVLPSIDTSNVTDASIAFAGCTSIERIPDYDFSSVTNVRRCFDGCRNVKYGILETYNKFLARGASITNHSDCFLNCGIDTEEGRAALEQIPRSWGGLAEG